MQELASLENHNKYLSDENKQKDKEKNNLHNEVNRLKAQIREMEKLYDSELGQQKEKVDGGVILRISRCWSRSIKEPLRLHPCRIKSYRCRLRMTCLSRRSLSSRMHWTSEEPRMMKLELDSRCHRNERRMAMWSS